MKAWNGVRRIFRLEAATDGVERAVDDELRFHFETKVDELVKQGMTDADARREAMRQFGDLQDTRAQLRELDRARIGHERRSEFWSNRVQDLRYAARGIRLNPRFAAAVILTLGLGIGANSAMFGIVDRVLLRPPALLRSPDQVHRVILARTFDGKERLTSNFQYARYLDLTKDTRSFEAVAAFSDDQLAIGTGTETKEERIGIASASFWSLFDMQPAIGRFFTAEEDQVPTGAAVAVLNYSYWREHYAGRAEVLGQQIQIGEVSYTIIGVAPEHFAGVEVTPVVVWIPITTYASLEMHQAGESTPAGTPSRFAPRRYYSTYNWSWMEMLVRRKPGVTLAAADADLTQAFQRSFREEGKIRASLPPIEEVRPHAMIAPIQRERGPLAAPESKLSIWLIGVTLIVLVIACANVGNLLLARALQRRQEVAVRLALGISRARLLMQMMTESLLLAVLGGLAAIALAQWGGGILRATLLPDVEWPGPLGDSRVLLFTGAVALLAGLLASIAPVLQSRTTNLVGALKSGGRDGTRRRSRAGSFLLVTQGALSVVLLVGAGLFVRSFHNVNTMRLGYDANQLLLVSKQSRGEEVTPEADAALKRELLERARALPEISNAARHITMPFWNTQSEDLFVAGIDSVGKLGEFDLQAVSPAYFVTTGTRIIRGRAISEADSRGAAPVMIVSQSMAKTLWKNDDALGKCVRVGADTSPCREVVGIAEDIKAGALRNDPSLLYYMSIEQYQDAYGGLFVRTKGAADASAAEAVRRALQPFLSGAAYITVRPFQSIVGREMRSWEIGATMFTIFGGLALVVAVVGLYSVIAYGVLQRRHEMGVRMALGAQTGDVVRLILSEGLRMGGISVAIGLALALFAGRWIQPLLFDVSGRDPVILIVVALLLLGVSLIASTFPALRAAKVDPNRTLRSE